MKFTKSVALIAIVGLAASASAYNDGTLRRYPNQQLAQNEYGSETSAKEVNININNGAQPSGRTVQQPATVVEAAPAVESKAEALRKARIGAEVQTEQKIVEKLEDARLQEERARADRLFGNRLDAQPVAIAPVVAPVTQPAPVAVAPAPAPVVAPPVTERATNVTIEKVEIVQPKEIRPEPVVESKMSKSTPDEEDEVKSKYYVSALAGNLNYATSNVKSNYALGVAVGTIIDERWAIELSYLFSNHYVDTYWAAPLYKSLDQNDFSAAAKYYILTNKIRPYVGASATYSSRKYTDRIDKNYSVINSTNTNTSDTTNAVDLGVLGGVDFAFTEHFMVGAGADYNFNVMNSNEINRNNYYNGGARVPDNAQPLEKISFWTVKLNVKYIF